LWAGRFDQAMTLLHRADEACLVPFLDQPDTLVGVALIAHLGDAPLAGRQFGQGAGLAQRVGERLLDEDVLAEVDRHAGGGEVDVVGSGDAHRVDPVAHFLEHLAEVLIVLRSAFLVLVHGLGRVLAVAIAESNHFAAAIAGGKVALSLHAEADPGEADPVVGAFGGLRENLWCGPGAARAGEGSLEEGSAGGVGGHGSRFHLSSCPTFRCLIRRFR
jgi:hypothetical protein